MGLDGRLRDMYCSFAHSQTFPEWRGYSKGMLQILVGQKYDQLEEVPFLCGHTSLKIVKRILKNSVTIMTYLKDTEKMPDQYCPDSDALWRKALELHRKLYTFNELARSQKERRRDHGHLVKKKHKRDQFGRVSLSSTAC